MTAWAHCLNERTGEIRLLTTKNPKSTKFFLKCSVFLVYFVILVFSIRSCRTCVHFASIVRDNIT
jgi:hypothetical protein